MENQSNLKPTQSTVHHDPDFNTHTLWIAIIGALLLIMALGVGILVHDKSVKEKTSMNENTSIEPTKVPVGGSFNFTTAATTVKAGQNTLVTIKGDSEGKSIVGFDILITYDPESVRINQVVSKNAEFQISSFTKKLGQISVTGTKTSGNSLAAILNASDLVTISVTPLRAGPLGLELKENIGNEKTKFIDQDYQEYTPNLGSLNLEVL